MVKCPNCGCPIGQDEFACPGACWKLLSRSLRTQITSFPHRYKPGVLLEMAHAEWAVAPGKRRRRVGV